MASNNVKTIAVLDESELKDGQMKDVDFEGGGKVLLTRLGDKIHATSAFCTHYGAPLARGVLTASGRVICPWHGACFNVCTGDIEDAPAPDALHSFKTSVSDGKIYVTAAVEDTKKENLARKPKSVRKSEAAALEASSESKGVVVVGGGSGGLFTIESLRESGYQGPITLISTEAHGPIDRTKLSKALITDPSKIEFRSAQLLRDTFNVDFKAGQTVTAVDPKAKTVMINGSEKLAYENLVLATGGVPRRLPIEGNELGNIYTLRSIENAKEIDAVVQEGKKLVFVGSSFIAMELVAVATRRKASSIDVIGMEEFPFQLVLGKEIGEALMKYHEKQGVRFHTSAKTTRYIPSSSDPKLVGGVEYEKDGQKIALEADAVILGVGVAPATKFLEGSGIPLERDGSIKVDEHLRVGGFDGLYAIGDIATYPQHPTGEPRRIEHWNVANNHGRAVGKAIAGLGQPFQKVPIFWSAQGVNLRYCGVGVGYQDVIVKGDLDELKFVAYYVKGETVVAVASMQSDPIVSKCSELIRLGLMPSASELKAGKDPLTIDISSSQAAGKA